MNIQRDIIQNIVKLKIMPMSTTPNKYQYKTKVYDTC